MISDVFGALQFYVACAQEEVSVTLREFSWLVAWLKVTHVISQPKRVCCVCLLLSSFKSFFPRLKKKCNLPLKFLNPVVCFLSKRRRGLCRGLRPAESCLCGKPRKDYNLGKLYVSNNRFSNGKKSHGKQESESLRLLPTDRNMDHRYVALLRLHHNTSRETSSCYVNTLEHVCQWPSKSRLLIPTTY